MIALIASTISCKEKKVEQRENETIKERQEKIVEESGQPELQNFRSMEWGVTFDHSKNFEVQEDELAPNSPVINIYPANAGVSPPLGIHEAAKLSYIALIPNGYGVDGPAGKRKPVDQWEGELPVNFNIDRGRSTVYLLDNNEPWGFLIKFRENPEKWQEQGAIFVRLGVRNFTAACEGSERGEKISMENCDPPGGDVVKYYGEVISEEKESIYTILRTLQFFSNDRKPEPLDDLIRVEMPLKNADISSPVKITGKAKGYWFFEAVAPVDLVNEDHKLLGQGTITATGKWMTEDLVPFEGSVEYNEHSEGKGFLILRRANASGKPEHDRAFYIPVKY